IRPLGEPGHDDAVRRGDDCRGGRGARRGRAGGRGRAADRGGRARREERSTGAAQQREDFPPSEDPPDRGIVGVGHQATGPVATRSTMSLISSVTLTTRKGTDGARSPKSSNFQVGFAVAVAVRVAPSRLAVTSNVTSFVVPRMVMLPVSVKVKLPLAGSGKVRPVTLVGTNSAFGNCLVPRVSCLMKLSRSR